MTSSDAYYAAAIRRAESLVVAVVDEKLRSVAFEVLLQRILTEGVQIAPRSSVHKATESLISAPLEKRTMGRPKVKNGPSEWLEDLHGEGYFSTPRTITEVVSEVAAKGHHVKSKDVSFPLIRLVGLKKLRRVRKQVGESNREVWVYTNY